MSLRGSAWCSVGLALRSLLWTVLLPGLVAGYLSWRFFGLDQVRIQFGDPRHLAGLALIIAGCVLLGACIWQFAGTGRGTLSPVDPPTVLVARGLYRYVRNPMYLSVTAILLGEVLLVRSTGLLLYWAAWFLAATLFVLGFEEPTLRRQFGASYEDYARRVGRWLPRRRHAR